MSSRPRRGAAAGAFAPAMPLLWAPPLLHALCALTLCRATIGRPVDGQRPHTLRAHAQSRWHLAAGWA